MLFQELHEFQKDYNWCDHKNYKNVKGDKLIFKGDFYNKSFLIENSEGEYIAEFSPEVALKRYKNKPELHKLIKKFSNLSVIGFNDNYIQGHYWPENDWQYFRMIIDRQTLEFVYLRIYEDVNYSTRWNISKIIKEKNLNCWVRKRNNYEVKVGTYDTEYIFNNLTELYNFLENVNQKQLDNGISKNKVV